VFVRWLGTIVAVNGDLHAKVQSPMLTGSDNVRDVRVEVEETRELLSSTSDDGNEALLDCFTSEDWEKVGFPVLSNRSVQAKLYYPHLGENAPKALQHPKFEVRQIGYGDQEKAPHWNEYQGTIDALQRSIILHCWAAGIKSGDLISDDFFDGADAPTRSWKCPAFRQRLLEQTDEGLANAVMGEAAKHGNSDNVLQVLLVLARQEGMGATYDDIAGEVEFARRTVRGYISDLVDAGLCVRKGSPERIVFFASERLRHAVLRAYKNAPAELRGEPKPEVRTDKADDVPSEPISSEESGSTENKEPSQYEGAAYKEFGDEPLEYYKLNPATLRHDKFSVSKNQHNDNSQDRGLPPDDANAA
jgi:succinate dehydrogenase flavin-adding protein (antitoxin of CptAB toxin-antitoxin module)